MMSYNVVLCHMRGVNCRPTGDSGRVVGISVSPDNTTQIFKKEILEQTFSTDSPF